LITLYKNYYFNNKIEVHSNTILKTLNINNIIKKIDYPSNSFPIKKNYFLIFEHANSWNNFEIFCNELNEIENKNFSLVILNSILTKQEKNLLKNIECLKKFFFLNLNLIFLKKDFNSINIKDSELKYLITNAIAVVDISSNCCFYDETILSLKYGTNILINENWKQFGVGPEYVDFKKISSVKQGILNLLKDFNKKKEISKTLIQNSEKFFDEERLFKDLINFLNNSK
jgi:hypothetical protein